MDFNIREFIFSVLDEASKFRLSHQGPDLGYHGGVCLGGLDGGDGTDLSTYLGYISLGVDPQYFEFLLTTDEDKGYDKELLRFVHTITVKKVGVGEVARLILGGMFSTRPGLLVTPKIGESGRLEKIVIRLVGQWLDLKQAEEMWPEFIARMREIKAIDEDGDTEEVPLNAIRSLSPFDEDTRVVSRAVVLRSEAVGADDRGVYEKTLSCLQAQRLGLGPCMCHGHETWRYQRIGKRRLIEIASEVTNRVAAYSIFKHIIPISQ
ncbi:MAG: hypothetical protein V1826_02595 [bacterium]